MSDRYVCLANSPDLPLFQAAAEAERIDKLWDEADDNGDWQTIEFLIGAVLPWLDKIAATPARTIDGVLLKLRLLADSLESGTSERDVPMLRDAIQFLEGLKAE